MSEKKPEVISLTPRQAFEKLQENPQALLVDVRSSMEFLFVGHPVGAVNIAWIDEPEWDINPAFAQEILEFVQGRCTPEEIPEDRPLLLICRSGVRSLDAGKVLLEAGFSQVYNVLEGFEGALDAEHHRGTLGGWRFHRLPWEQC
jgi:rhodanese-related sulfurtransferase